MGEILKPLNQTLAQHIQPNLLVGLAQTDDAAIYQLNEAQAIINTTDFFTPVVNDPYDYGAIAAANAMSDVYAMGGEVLFALNVAGFPASLDTDIISEILRGGLDKVVEAGGVIAGGHTVQDDEPKYGLAVTGLVHPQKYFTKGGAKPSDVLVLTKALGTGTVSTALKREIADEAHAAETTASMKKLNREAAQAAQETGKIRSATDITGFGLLGHALEMAKAGEVQFHFIMKQFPFLSGAEAYAEQFIFPGGASNNKLCFEQDVSFADYIPDHEQMLLWDPQTSGGLLLAIPADSLEIFQAACDRLKQKAWVVGQVQAGQGIKIS